jgi:hypothetical protein
MPVLLQPLSDKTRLALEKLTLLKARLFIVEGLRSKSFSRIQRADRLRQNFNNQAKGEQFASLVSATEFEIEAYKSISIIPIVHKSLKKEIQAIFEELDEEE